MNSFVKTIVLVSALSIGASACSASGSPSTPEASGSSEAADTVSANGLVSGRYQGTGQFRDSTGGSGSYAVTYTITADAVSIHYDWGTNAPRDDGSFDLTMKLTWTSTAEFSYSFADFGGGGTGYCVDSGCHFAMDPKSPVPFEQTLVFGDGLTAVGSKSVPASGGASTTTITWTERLTKTDVAPF